jgi:hypothetical protein
MIITSPFVPLPSGEGNKRRGINAVEECGKKKICKILFLTPLLVGEGRLGP